MQDIDLSQRIWDLNNELTQSIKLLRRNGTELAEREREYKIALSTEVLRLKQENKLAVTLINLVIYGVPKIAELRFKRDVAQSTYTANQEHINVTKLQIRLLESQLNREWGNPNNV